MIPFFTNHVPKVLALLLLFISSLPWGFAGFHVFFPLVDAITIFYWCNKRPSLMPGWFIFLLGLLRDSISGAPLGMAMLANFIMRMLALSGRRYYMKENFLLLWQAFFLFIVILSLFYWGAYSFIFSTFVDIGMLTMQAIITIILYPLFHGFFNQICAFLGITTSHVKQE